MRVIARKDRQFKGSPENSPPKDKTAILAHLAIQVYRTHRFIYPQSLFSTFLHLPASEICCDISKIHTLFFQYLRNFGDSPELPSLKWRYGNGEIVKLPTRYISGACHLRKYPEYRRNIPNVLESHPSLYQRLVLSFHIILYREKVSCKWAIGESCLTPIAKKSIPTNTLGILVIYFPNTPKHSFFL